MSGVLLVTGGSRGVGAAICRAAGRNAFKVAVNYFSSPPEKVAEVVGAIHDDHGEAIAVRGDCSKEADIVAMFDEIDHRLGRITALVNNAGGAVGWWPVLDLTTDRLNAVMGLNLIGPILCAREAVRRMASDRGGEGGAIVNVSSTAAQNGGFCGLAGYAAAKGGLESFTVSLANEVGDKGIRVNCIRLGAIETDAHANDTPEWRDAMNRTIVLKRYGRPEEAGAAAAFLLSNEASYITGAILPVSGGRR